uniref:Peroxiredoxin-like 2A n=1 Tax=Acanthochromis polyacanthus TaxID=80966 RepID=A0A3Q1FJP2_9TELE
MCFLTALQKLVSVLHSKLNDEIYLHKRNLRAFKNGFSRNVPGEGFVLGGVFIIAQGEQGILLEHREMEFGDKVNIEAVIRAVRRISQEQQPEEH